MNFWLSKKYALDSFFFPILIGYLTFKVNNKNSNFISVLVALLAFSIIIYSIIGLIKYLQSFNEIKRFQVFLWIYYKFIFLLLFNSIKFLNKKPHPMNKFKINTCFRINLSSIILSLFILIGLLCYQFNNSDFYVTSIFIVLLTIILALFFLTNSYNSIKKKCTLLWFNFQYR